MRRFFFLKVKELINNEEVGDYTNLLLLEKDGEKKALLVKATNTTSTVSDDAQKLLDRGFGDLDVVYNL